jgi:hypothetical protein
MNIIFCLIIVVVLFAVVLVDGGGCDVFVVVHRYLNVSLIPCRFNAVRAI